MTSQPNYQRSSYEIGNQDGCLRGSYSHINRMKNVNNTVATLVYLNVRKNTMYTADLVQQKLVINFNKAIIITGASTIVYTWGGHL